MNLKKLDKMGGLAFRNAIRLHLDSIKLFKAKSYPSAYLLSILSQEELGKAFSLEDYVFYERTTPGRSSYQHLEEHKKFEREYIGLLYKHPWKQAGFMRFLEGSYTPSMWKRLEKVGKGDLEAAKQKATYVGLKKKNGKPNLSGKIDSPFEFNKSTALNQITKINDSLIKLVVGQILGYYGYDNEKIVMQLSRRLYRKLITQWPRTTKKAKSKIEQLFKHDRLHRWTARTF